MLFEWLKRSDWWINTNSPGFVQKPQLRGYSETPERELSILSGAKKNSLWQLRDNSPKLLRQKVTSYPGLETKSIYAWKYWLLCWKKFKMPNFYPLTLEKSQISFTSERKGEIKRNYSDISKAQKSLGFSPQVDLRGGVKEVYEWFRRKDVDEIKNAQVLSGSE